MSTFWEGFWFVLSKLSNVNGAFVILAALISTPWQRAIATIVWTAVSRWIFEGNCFLESVCVYKPKYIDLAAVTLNQLLLSSIGLKWTLIVIPLGLTAVPFFTGYFALSLTPGPPLNVGWRQVLLSNFVNIECVMAVLYSCGQKGPRECIYCCKYYQVMLGMLLLMQSVTFGLLQRGLERKRQHQMRADRAMNEEIGGLGSLIPVGWSHARAD